MSDLYSHTNRRDFLKWLAGLPSVYWPMLAFFDRLFWTPKLISIPPVSSCDKYTEWLINQIPKYDEEIIRDFRATDSWMGTVVTGTFPVLTCSDWKRSESGLIVPDDLIPTDA